jgi:hypothetical protein
MAVSECVCCANRPAESGFVCPVCRSKIPNWLTEIAELYDKLTGAEPLLIPGPGKGGRVSGSAEAPVPIRIDPFDLSAPAAALFRLTAAGHLHPEDQVGYQSAATTLDFWVQDLREHRQAGERLPEPGVTVLTGWLRERIGDACDDWPPVGMVEVPDYKTGVPCRGCDMLTLVHRNGSDFVECDSCPVILTAEDYSRWTALLASGLCGRRHGERSGDWWCRLPRKHDGGCEPVVWRDTREAVPA